MNGRTLTTLLAAVALTAGRAAAQAPTDDNGARMLASRAELKRAQARLTAAGKTEDAALVNRRLTEGDFQPGDHILLIVTAESTLTDTFVVDHDRTLALPPPVAKAVSLQGVLRSELESTLTDFISRYVRSPDVRASTLVRLSIQGQVAKAGFYGVPARGLLSDALMAAGGTTHDADMKKIKIERNGETLLKDQAMRVALASNMTLDQLGLRNGDEIVIGKKGGAGTYDNLRFVALLVSTAVGIYTLSRVVN
jgi:polysaccharide export outer membrane protein